MTAQTVRPAVTPVGVALAFLCALPNAAAFPPATRTAFHASAPTAPTARECEVLPRRNLRVRLTSAAGEFAWAMPAVARHIAGFWAVEGVQIQWIAGESSEQHAEVDVWIAILRELDTAPRGQVLGIVQFDRGLPLRLVRVSLNAVILWLQRQRARQLDAPALLLPPTLSGAPPKLAEALAYVGAHELGHYLLASRRHAARGLMRSVYDQPELLDVSHVWRLDASSRKVLQRRMRDGGACSERREHRHHH